MVKLPKKSRMKFDWEFEWKSQGRKKRDLKLPFWGQKWTKIHPQSGLERPRVPNSHLE